MNLHTLDFREKFVGRKPRVFKLRWGKNKKQEDDFVISRVFNELRKTVTFDESMKKYLDPYEYYLVESKRFNDEGTVRTSWKMFVKDDNELYGCLYWGIMSNSRKSFLKFYERTRNKEITSYEVLSYFCL